MPVPQLPTKLEGRPYVTPPALLDYRRSQGLEDRKAPRAVICTWQGTLMDRVLAARSAIEVATPAGKVVQLSPDIGFLRLPIGAPVIAIVVEELAASGTEAVVGVGTAGGLQEDLHPGDLVVCSKALRDEGASHHYAPPARFAEPDAELTDRVRVALPDARVGPSWTTDAPYRETAEEIAAYRAEGILAVEMEGAALFTVGHHVGIRTALVLGISDVLCGLEWEPHFHAPGVLDAQWRAFEAVEAVLKDAPGPGPA